jgi:hypothetical protein
MPSSDLPSSSRQEPASGNPLLGPVTPGSALHRQNTSASRNRPAKLFSLTESRHGTLSHEQNRRFPIVPNLDKQQPKTHRAITLRSTTRLPTISGPQNRPRDHLKTQTCWFTLKWPSSAHFLPTIRALRILPGETAGPIDHRIDQPPPFRIPAKNPTATAARFLSRLRRQTIPKDLAMGYGSSQISYKTTKIGLFADAKLRQQVQIVLRVVVSDIVQQSSTPSHHGLQTTTSPVILRIRLHMFRQVIDPRRQNRDLNIRRTRIAALHREFIDQGRLFFFRDCH